MQALGKILEEVRRQQGYEKRDVYEGICSLTTYTRIEEGKREPDKIIFDALLQRLGKSTDQFEAVLGEEEYRYLLLKEALVEAVYDNNEKRAEDLKAEAEKNMPQNNIKKQFIKMIEGILAYQQGQYHKSAVLLEEAYKITANHRLFFHQEYIVRLMQHEVNQKLGMKDRILEELYQYCITRVTDTRELVKLLPKTVECMAAELSRDGEWERIYVLTEEAIKLLSVEGELICYLELLEYQQMAVRQMNMKETVERLELEIECLKQIYTENGCGSLTRIQRLLRNSIRREYYLMSEYFKNNRMVMEKTQEELAGICGDRHWRRIESGECKNVQSVFERMKTLLNNDRNKMTSYLSAQSFRELELNAKCAASISRLDYESSKGYWEELKSMEHDHLKQFEQVMGRREVVFGLQQKKITNEEAIAECERLIKLTQPYYEISKIRMMETNRAETEILSQMAVCYRGLGDLQTSERIRKESLLHYNNSRMGNRYSAAQMILMLQHLVGLIEVENRFDESLSFCDYGIKLALECGWANCLQGFLTQKGYTLERKYGTDAGFRIKQKIIAYYTQGYIISNLVGDKVTSGILREHLREIFNVSLAEQQQVPV